MDHGKHRMAKWIEMHQSQNINVTFCDKKKKKTCNTQH